MGEIVIIWSLQAVPVERCCCLGCEVNLSIPAIDITPWVPEIFSRAQRDHLKTRLKPETAKEKSLVPSVGI